MPWKNSKKNIGDVLPYSEVWVPEFGGFLFPDESGHGLDEERYDDGDDRCDPIGDKGEYDRMKLFFHL
jgi:hypothetical protein